MDNLAVGVHSRRDVKHVQYCRDVDEERAIRKMLPRANSSGVVSGRVMGTRRANRDHLPSTVSKHKLRWITDTWIQPTVAQKAVRVETIRVKIGGGVVQACPKLNGPPSELLFVRTANN